MNDKTKKESESSEERLHNPDTLIKIAVYANLFAWVFLVINLLLFAQGILQIGEDVYEPASWRFFDTLLLWGNNPLMSLGNGVVSFLVLQAVSKGIYLVLDVEADTREILDQLKKRKE